MMVRLIGEMQLGSATDVVRTLEERLGRPILFDRAIFLLTILRESSRFRAASTGVVGPRRRPGAPDRGAGISINAVAMSLNRPFETVRRHVTALIEDGICERTSHGVVVRDETIESPDFTVLLRSLHDRLVSLIEDFARFDVPLPTTHEDRAYDPDATIATAIDITLAPFEYVGNRYSTWLEMAIINAVVIANARPFTFDPVRGRCYADAGTVPPDDMRQSVSVSALARGLRMSYSTVRREIEAAYASGKLKRVPGGALATTAFLADVTIARGGELAAARVSQMLQRLGPGGFRFDDPGSCYLDGKPKLVEFA